MSGGKAAKEELSATEMQKQACFDPCHRELQKHQVCIKLRWQLWAGAVVTHCKGHPERFFALC